MQFRSTRKSTLNYEKAVLASIAFVVAVIIASQIFIHHAIQREEHHTEIKKKYIQHEKKKSNDDTLHEENHYDPPPAKTESDNFVPTLRGKKIFVEVTTVGQTQYAYFERVLDSVRDICEAGAHVSLHVTTTNCNPNPGSDEEECPLYGQYAEETEEDNYSVEKINQLNERLRCRNPEGSLTTDIHLVSSFWGKEVVNHHRRLFYDNINKGYDLFVHTEEDEAISPTNVIAFMDELEKVRRLVGDERLPDYSIGFIRYENDFNREDQGRVVWEFKWDDEIDVLVDHPNIRGMYFTSPPWHHQGMFMCTQQQLINWANRGPECKFDKPVRREAYHRERTSGALDLFDKEVCNVTQLIPLDSLEDFYIHHLPDKNSRRSPNNIISTMNLHKWRMQKIKEMDSNRKLWIDQDGNYNGIKMYIDEIDEKRKVHFDIKDYEAYVKRGGIMNDDELREWDYVSEEEE